MLMSGNDCYYSKVRLIVNALDLGFLLLKVRCPICQLLPSVWRGKITNFLVVSGLKFPCRGALFPFEDKK